MVYALVLRKMVINNTIYYQVMDKVIGEKDSNDTIHVIEGDHFLNQVLNSYGTEKDIVYLEVEKENYDNFDVRKTEFLKEENGTLVEIADLIEQNHVILQFFYRYRDFKLIPDYDSFQLIQNLKEEMLKKIIGQNQAISKILAKLYNNLMFSETDLDPIDIQKNKSNILVMGPIGTGKTTIKKIMKENLSPIPVIEYQLTGDYQTDIKNIFKKLVLASDGNLYLASRGIVIFDGINSSTATYVDTETETLYYYMDTLKKILATQSFQYIDKDQNAISFDYSLVTNICMIDIDYDYEEENTDLYTRIDFSKILELGFEEELFYDYFDGEIVYMEEMTEELAFEILKDKKISPLYQIKHALEEKGKTVRISRDFVKELIRYGLDFEEGFKGIARTLKYLLQNKDLSYKNVTFKKEDFDYLGIGTVFPDDADDLSKQGTMKQQSDLVVDCKKKTINHLTKKDTIDLVKKEIKGQDEQVFAIVNSFFEHIFSKYKGFSEADYRTLKDNMLIIGGSGVGKTSIVENLMRIFNIPFIRVDATSYSSTGIVGKDVESIVDDLVKVCNGDVAKAETGVIFIDELDKIASSFDRVDIGKGVQNALLTLIEGNKITINPNRDFRGFSPSYTIDTSKILFIGAGVFEGLEEITRKRIKKEKNGSTMGFKETSEESLVIEEPTVDDLDKYGMSMQLMSRLPNVVNLNFLNEDVLFNIISSEKGYVNLKVRSYKYDGIIIEMSEGFKRSLAKAAYQDKKGARSIKTIFKGALTEIDKNILENDVERVVLNDDSLTDYTSIQYIKRKNR